MSDYTKDLNRAADDLDVLEELDPEPGRVGLADRLRRYAEATEVPWCDEHDQPMLPGVSYCYPFAHEAVFGACRLEEPARHYVRRRMVLPRKMGRPRMPPTEREGGD